MLTRADVQFTLTVKGRYDGDPFRLEWCSGSLIGHIPREELSPGERDASGDIEWDIQDQIKSWRRRPESSMMKYAMSKTIEDPDFFLYTLHRLSEIWAEREKPERLEIEEIVDDPPGHLELFREMQGKVCRLFHDIRDYVPPYRMMTLWAIIKDPRRGPRGTNDPEKDPYPVDPAAVALPPSPESVLRRLQSARQPVG